jgi:hypothetical protein
MPKEKELYRENLVRLDAAFPGKEMLTLKEAADYVGLWAGTLRDSKSFPKIKVNRNYMVPKTRLASWLA